MAIQPGTLIADPNTANQLAAVVPATGDGKSLSTSFELVVGSTPLLENASGTFDQQRAALGTTGVPSVNTEGTRATYSAASLGLTPAATATDFFQIVGSASKTVRVTRVQISGLATAAATNDIQLVKRTAANTGGTSASVSIAQHDSNSAAPSATVNSYSANPSALGAGVAIRGEKLNLGAAGAAGVIVWDFTTRNSQGLVLRGVAQSLNLNWNGAAVPSGTLLDIDVEWTEE